MLQLRHLVALLTIALDLARSAHGLRCFVCTWADVSQSTPLNTSSFNIDPDCLRKGVHATEIAADSQRPDSPLFCYKTISYLAGNVFAIARTGGSREANPIVADGNLMVVNSDTHHDGCTTREVPNSHFLLRTTCTCSSDLCNGSSFVHGQFVVSLTCLLVSTLFTAISDAG